MSAPQLTVSPESLRMTPHVGNDGITLAVTNPAPDKSVLYKCKTTSPARYVVRNRQGVIAPGGQQTVLITLQRGVVITGEEDNDIFLIESRYLDAGEVESAARNDVSSELMKAKGRSAVGKIQVRCELSLGAAAAVSNAASPSSLAANRSNDGLVSEAQSTHTQPERVKSTAPAATLSQRSTGAADPSPAPRDPAAAAAQPSRTATTSVRRAPAKSKKSPVGLYVFGAVVVIAAAYFAGFIGGDAAPAASPAAEESAAPVVADDASQPTPASGETKSETKSPSKKTTSKKTAGSSSA